MHTSLHTSARRLAVRSRISLRLMEGNPPLAHESAVASHLDGGHPYRWAMASWKAALCNVKPRSLRGRAVSQMDATFSWAKSLCSGGANWLCSVLAYANACDQS